MKSEEKAYIEETIVVIRPANNTHIFDEELLIKVLDQYDTNGVRTVFLRENKEYGKKNVDLDKKDH